MRRQDDGPEHRGARRRLLQAVAQAALVAAALLAAAMFAGEAAAQWRDPASGAALPDTPARQSGGGLVAQLVVTQDTQAFVENSAGTAAAQPPKVAPAGKLERGDVVSILVYYSGCGSDGGSCDATLGFKVLRPDGSTYGETGDYRVRLEPVARRDAVALSDAHLRIRIEPQDPPGVYRVLADFAEPRSGRRFSLQEQFEVVR